MKRTLGVAALVALMIGALASTALAQCGTGPLIDWDENGFAYETNYDADTFGSANGSQLTVVGKIVLFCAPFQDLDALDPTKEYTFVFSGLTSGGTVHTPVGGGTTRHQTLYGAGVFAIYEDTSPDAPNAASMPPNPPNVDVPALYSDGTLILSGTLNNFETTITQFGTGTFATSFRGDYQFTGPIGGTYYIRVQGQGADQITGLWCAAPGGGGGGGGGGVVNVAPPGLCDLSAGYSAHANGKFDTPPVTANESSTWGAVKLLYR